MGSAGIGMTFSVVLRWAREQCCNLALTGHWIWATPWRGVTWGEVVLCSWGSFQGGLTAAGCLLTVRPLRKPGASPFLKGDQDCTSQCCHLGQIKSSLGELHEPFTYECFENQVLKKPSNFVSFLTSIYILWNYCSTEHNLINVSIISQCIAGCVKRTEYRWFVPSYPTQKSCLKTLLLLY